ncbi:interleukin-15 receptor subunit alpha isoform X3 [Sebastes umbrosus]|uniref:interleukin-15 receptor subunit alpha isoform X3 n=1 Tax=Sebastes umbrosus TaxID=72105 RepID=UPI0018A0913E|nr:interleukin-15 receptor subunit alpha isoform X3 [Sebastes umbrosus]
MDLGSPLFSVCLIIMICLLGAAHAVEISCPCAEIPKKLGTEPPPENCFKISFRYTCKGGFVRKAGTSNLIRCKQKDGTPQWLPYNITLQCIPDPNITPTQPPEIRPVTQGHTDIPHHFTFTTTVIKTSCPCPKIPSWPETKTPPEKCSKINATFRYECKEGYVRTVGTSNLIKCNETGGPHWSSPSLKCKLDPNRTPTQPPNSPVTQGHTDIPHGSTLTTTVTAASSSLQTTQTISLSASASVTAETETETETDRTETTSPGLRPLSGLSQEKVNLTENNATQRTASNSITTEPSNPNTDFYAQPIARTVIGCASLIIVCALIGITFFCYRRTSKSANPTPTPTPEEQTPMNCGPSEHDL